MRIHRKQNQDGFSLIELVVVIAVIAILSVAAITGISTLSGWKMKQCSRQIDTAISETQLENMSKTETVLTLTRDAGGNYYMQQTGMEKVLIADKAIRIYYVTDIDDTEQLLTEANSLGISFERSSGAYRPIQTDPLTYCKKIIIRMGDKKEISIRLVKETGRHDIE